MKKTIIIFVTIALLIVSALFNYNLFSKLEVAELQSEALMVDLEASEGDKVTLEKTLLQQKSKLAEAEQELQVVTNDLQASNKQLQIIDTKLRADGNIIEKIEQLKSDNNKWREALNAMTKDFNELQSQEPEIDKSNESQSQVPEIDESNGQSIGDLEAIIDFIDARINVLEDAVSKLPVLSLERIMIQQEVTFLAETRTSVKTVMDALSSEE